MSINTESETPDAQPATTPTDASSDVESEMDVDDATTTETAGETQPEVEPEPEPESEPNSEPEPEPETDAETDVDVDEDAEEDAEEGTDVVTGPPRQFQAAIPGGDIKEFVGTLRAIVDEAKFNIRPDGIRVRAVDPANVAMDDGVLSAGAFESYDASEGVLGLNLERLEEVLKLAKKDDLVEFLFDTNTFKLVIHIDGVEFTMACIDPDSIRMEPEIPDMDLPASFTVDESQISRGVKAADMVSDHIQLRCDETEQAVFIEAEGDTDDVCLELTEDEYTELTAVDAEALFSLDYVKDISRKFPKKTEISITFGTDFPMMIEYEFADGECEILSMVAPRIRSD
ncbi:DNA polymerase sliding clamp [Halorarius halobius]|uniref:DNA polymerase sliding clamp n=1 Tax=Halorarius halobius TaxID=2962671 RepID=UPI0020CD31AB|nr:DNA polymerase sliding clamp [Halorarius halobius]